MRTERYCPNCHWLYSIHHYRLGSPLRECSMCHQRFVDKTFREPFLLDPPEIPSFSQALRVTFFPSGFLVVAMLLIAIFVVDHISGLLLPAIAFVVHLLFAWGYWHGSRRAFSAKIEAYQLSKKRLENKEYVKFLPDHDCFLPDYFVKRYHRDLKDYVPKGPSLPKCLSCIHVRNRITDWLYMPWQH